MATTRKKVLQSKSEYAIFRHLKDIIWDYNIPWLAEAAGVGEATLYFWLDGTTKAPRISTMLKVAHAIGYDIVLVERKQKGKGHLRVVK